MINYNYSAKADCFICLPHEGAKSDKYCISVKTTEIIGNTVGANCVRPI